MKHGDPLVGGTRYGAPKTFLDAAMASDTDECIVWPYATTNGYGVIRANGTAKQVHRLVCVAKHGNPPEHGLEAAHSCGNRGCCNPRHIRWATPLENSGDKLAHGTLLYGERGPRAKLTETQVAEIRGLLGRLSQRRIAQMYGVGQQAVSLINTGKNWRRTPQTSNV